jgi:hypothetical protein
MNWILLWIFTLHVSAYMAAAAKQIPSGLKSKISYTPEDGHVGRNM